MLTFANVHGKKSQKGNRANPKAGFTLEYITEELDKDGNPKCVLTSVLDLESSINSFERTRDRSNSHYKEKEVHHYVASFDSETLDPLNEQDQRTAFAFAARLAEELYPENDCEWGVHANTENLHVHFAVNAFNRNGIGKFHTSFSYFQDEAYPIINEIEKEFGMTPTNFHERMENNREAKKNGTYHEEKSGEIRMKKHGRVGWKQEIIETVSKAKFTATSLEEFDSILNEHGVRRYNRSKTKFGYEHLGRLETHEPKHARITNGNRTIKENKLTIEDVEKQIKINKTEPKQENVVDDFGFERRKTKKKKRNSFQKKKSSKNIPEENKHAWLLKRKEKEYLFEHDREKLRSCQTEADYKEALKQLEVKQQLDEWEEEAQKKHERYMKELEQLTPIKSSFERELDKLFDSILENVFDEEPNDSRKMKRIKSNFGSDRKKLMKILQKEQETEQEINQWIHQNENEMEL